MLNSVFILAKKWQSRICLSAIFIALTRTNYERYIT